MIGLSRGNIFVIILSGLLSIGSFWLLFSDIHKCQKCNGSGKISKQVEHKETCSKCKGRRNEHCQWSDSWTKKRSDGGIPFFGATLSLVNGPKKDVTFNIWYSGGYKQVSTGAEYRRNQIGDPCPRCNGTAKQDCTNCSGYGYLTNTKTEYYDDIFCAGKGKVSNFKRIFN